MKKYEKPVAEAVELLIDEELANEYSEYAGDGIGGGVGITSSGAGIRD